MLANYHSCALERVFYLANPTKHLNEPLENVEHVKFDSSHGTDRSIVFLKR